MSSTFIGNSKEQVVLNSGITDQISVVNDRVTTEKAYLVSLVNSEASSRAAADVNLNNLLNAEIVNRQDAVSGEASSRTAADGVLDARISTEKSFLLARIADEATSRTSAINSEIQARQLADETNNALRVSGDATNDARITTEKQYLIGLINTEAASRAAADTTINALINSEKSAVETAVAAEAASRVSADNVLNTRITDEKAYLVGLNTAVSSRVTTLESGLTQQIQTQLSGQVYDAAQRALINQAVQSLGDADSVIYTKIAQKASILMENQFKGVFNLFIQDFFASYTLGSNNVNFTASRYAVSNSTAVNEDPTL